MELIFDGIPKRKILYRVITFCNLVIMLKLSSSDWSKILYDVGNALLNTYKITIDPHYNDGYPEIMFVFTKNTIDPHYNGGYPEIMFFYEEYKRAHSRTLYFVICNFGHCLVHLSSWPDSFARIMALECHTAHGPSPRAWLLPSVVCL